MSNFQTILLFVFGAVFVVAVLIFSGLIKVGGGSAGAQYSGTVVLWGTIDDNVMQPLVDTFNLKKTYVLKYSHRNPDTFVPDLIDALAAGKGPDLVMLPQADAWSLKDKLTPIPYVSFPQRTFQDSFISLGDLFLTKDGILALPFTVDPMVMYWNRDILTNANIATPPATWDDVVDVVSKVTEKLPNATVTRSGVALGTFDNIKHAKDIIALLALQAGNPITAIDTQGSLRSVFTTTGSNANNIPVKSAITFYTGFADPIASTYTWNAGLSDSFNEFLSNDLALYFGYASEISSIRKLNPNLNFDVSGVPQSKTASIKATFGHLTGLALTRGSKNQATALFVATELTSADFLAKLNASLLLPPVRRDLLTATTTDPYLGIFNASALSARAWRDPEPVKSDAIFKELVDTIRSGSISIDQAIIRTSGELDGIIK